MSVGYNIPLVAASGRARGSRTRRTWRDPHHDDRDEHTLDRLPFTRIESLFNGTGVVAALSAVALGVIIKLEMRGSPDKDDPSALTGLYELVAGYGIGTAIPDAWVPNGHGATAARCARARGAYRSQSSTKYTQRLNRTG